jgi:hypothetical protein
MDLGGIVWDVNCIELAQDKNQLKDIANKVMNLRIA